MNRENRMRNEYRFNRRFREYVDRYRRACGCTLEEAFSHETVRQACLHFTEV